MGKMSKNKTRTKDKYRVVYNDTQRIELENEFNMNEYIAIPRKQEIAQKLQLSERQIKIWFQNRRAKKRKQQKRRVTHSAEIQPIVAGSTNTNTSNASSVVAASAVSGAASVAAASSRVAMMGPTIVSTAGPCSPTTSAGSQDAYQEHQQTQIGAVHPHHHQLQLQQQQQQQQQHHQHHYTPFSPQHLEASGWQLPPIDQQQHYATPEARGYEPTAYASQHRAFQGQPYNQLDQYSAPDQFGPVPGDDVTCNSSRDHQHHIHHHHHPHHQQHHIHQHHHPHHQQQQQHYALHHQQHSHHQTIMHPENIYAAS